MMAGETEAEKQGGGSRCKLWHGDSDEDIAAAAEALRMGKAVAFPTETVYGLGALASDDAAVMRIFAAKGRPADNPLIVHFADGQAGLEACAEGGQVPSTARRLAEAFWPGPLSICIRANKETVSERARAGLDTVAVRVPDHPIALKLLRALGKYVGVAAPSANASGRPSPTQAEHVLCDLGDRIEGVVDGGKTCSVGLESTVIDCTVDPPVILRPGKISREEIQAVLGLPVMDYQHSAEVTTEEAVKERPKAPGMKYRHYAPRAGVTVVEGSAALFVQSVLAKLEEADEADSHGRAWLGVMAPQDILEELRRSGGEKLRQCVLAACGDSVSDQSSIARDLFAVLRSFDEMPDVTDILAHGTEAKGLGKAIRNRLDKAALRSDLDPNKS
mmetsp:Transcript_21761/g.71976  ORF Transcript_21761/g.71976 Transcript_21761/m.71976 type:complete len:389 (+) Transcript_21761:338-1504(+)